MEKLKDKKAEYEAIASSDSFVNLDDIDNKIITKYLGPERYGRVRFQGSGVNPTQYFGSSLQQYMPSGSQAQVKVLRLRDQMAQIGSSSKGSRGSSKGSRGSNKGSRAEQKVQLTPAIASKYDEDVSAVAKSAILDICFLIEGLYMDENGMLQICRS
ncbi:hypothetical protein J1N35_045100 [Gossypium stocksii]|uniref:Uncharacterized protein n=1 Tax=Gossypium stocksii TaxID=47602 RepID=A0A9D3UAT8_9ROSI|nr:hypothetical protein J1N35_045100 [Gossypium stocksii]